MKRIIRLVLALSFSLALTLTSFAVVPAGSATLTATPVLLTTSPQTGRVTLVYYNCGNPNASLVYVQFFDAASAGAVTLGTTAPKFWVAVPAYGGVVDTTVINGCVFNSGLVAAVTTTPTGSTAPTSACPLTVFFQ